MRSKIIPFTAFLSIFLILQSCEEYTYKTYTGNSPVYMSYEELRSGIVTRQDASLEKPGKLFFRDNYIFITEEMKGIHVIDNSNPSSPVNVTFIEVPGVMDISVSGSVLYADSYVDLVILDLQDILNIRESGRIKDFLPYVLPPAGNNLPLANIDISKGVVTGWEVKRIREKDRYYGGYIPYIYYKRNDEYVSTMNPCGASRVVSTDGVSAGGSIARFGIRENTLYAVTGDGLTILDITDKKSPVVRGSVEYLWGIETMFLSGKYMFIGTMSGLQIFDLSVPLSPQDLGWFNQATACDPFILDDTLAYISQRSNTNCGVGLNQLKVVNIKDILNPKPVVSYTMTNPLGLSKKGDLLFLCDGAPGLKIFDASDPWALIGNTLKIYFELNAYNVVPLNGILFLLGEDGFFQYDCSDVQDIRLVSFMLTDK